MIKYDKAKVVRTQDSNGRSNGILVELAKEGKKITSYMTVVNPKSVKGYYLHRIREANYVCINGEIEIKMFTYGKNGVELVRYLLRQGDKLHIPKYIPTAIANRGKHPAWIINFPNPACDPDLTDEQIEFTEEECRDGKFVETLKEDGVI